MAITDLTNTTWRLKSSLKVLASIVKYDIKGTAISGEYSLPIEYIQFNTVSTSSTSYYVVFARTSNYFFRYYGGWEYYTLSSGWISGISPPLLTITGGTDVANSDLISWLSEYGELQTEEPDIPEEPTPTATITYDGATVTLKEGQTVTFRFAEKVFKSDIVIRNNVKESLISFTIDGTTYYAEAGMTWGEWVADTSLNTDGYFIDTSNKNWIGIGTGPAWVGNEQGNSMVTQADTIITNGIYITMHSGGSND